MTQLAAKTAENLRKIRESKPLIHNITNFVVMNTTANVLLACGASPNSIISMTCRWVCNWPMPDARPVRRCRGSAVVR